MTICNRSREWKKAFVGLSAAGLLALGTAGSVWAGTFIASDGAASAAADQAAIAVEGSGSTGNAVTLDFGDANSPLEAGIKIAVNAIQNYRIQVTLSSNATFGAVPNLTTDGAGTTNLDGNAANDPDVTLTSGSAGDSTLTFLVNNALPVNSTIVLDGSSLSITGLDNNETVTATFAVLDTGLNQIDSATGTIATAYNVLSAAVYDAANTTAGAQGDEIKVESNRTAFSTDGTDLTSQATVRIMDDDDPAGNSNLVAFAPGTQYDATFTVTSSTDFTGVSRVWMDTTTTCSYASGTDTELTGTTSKTGTVSALSLTDDGTTSNTLCILVDGSTALESRTFQVAVSLAVKSGGTATFNDRTDLLSATDLISWTMNGTTFFTPYVNATNSYYQSFRFANKSATSGTLSVTVRNSDGTKSSSVTLGTLAANSILTVSSPDIKTAVDASGGITVSAVYSAEFVVTLPATSVHAEVYGRTANGSQRVYKIYKFKKYSYGGSTAGTNEDWNM